MKVAKYVNLCWSQAKRILLGILKCLQGDEKLNLITAMISRLNQLLFPFPFLKSNLNDSSQRASLFCKHEAHTESLNLIHFEVSSCMHSTFEGKKHSQRGLSLSSYKVLVPLIAFLVFQRKVNVLLFVFAHKP